MEVRYVPTEYQPANIFTKALPADRFQWFLRGRDENIVAEVQNLSIENSQMLGDLTAYLAFVPILKV